MIGRSTESRLRALADFGRQQTAYVELDVEGPAGARVDLGTAERLVDGHFNNAIEGQLAARYVLRDGDSDGARCRGRGIRYLWLCVGHAEGPVTIHGRRGDVSAVTAPAVRTDRSP